jgi:predicted branched-subunit amino acid permease
MLLTHHLLSVHLLLLLWGLLVKRHLILGQTSYKGGVAMMMLMMYAGAAQLILVVLSPCTDLAVLRSGRLRFELDARHVAYHDQIS